MAHGEPPKQQLGYAIALGDIPAIVTGISSISLAISVVYEWAYFSVIGAKYLSLLTIADYFGAAIEWLPFTILVTMLSIATYFAMTRITYINESLRRAMTGHASGWGALPAAIGVMVATWGVVFLFVPSYVVAPYLVTLAIPAVVAMLYALRAAGFLRELVQRRSPFDVLVLLAIILIPFGVYYFGIQEAYLDMQMPRRMFALTTKEHPTAMPVVVLRNLQNGILVRVVAADRNDFLRWEDVKSLSNLSFPPPAYSRSCMRFGFPCFGKAETVEP